MKNYSISVIRAIAFLSIISCHILQGLGSSWAFWVNIGVQVFFFISGFLYGGKQIKSPTKFYLDKLEKILFPTSLLVLIMMVVERLLFKQVYDFDFSIAALLGFGGFTGNMLVLTHLWFISYILLFYLATPVLEKMFEEENPKKNILTFLVALVIIYGFWKFRVWAIDPSLATNYLFGYFYGRFFKNKQTKKVFIGIIVALSVLIVPLSIVVQERLVDNLPKEILDYETIIIGYGHVLIGSLIFMGLYKIYPKKLNNKALKKMLDFSDKFSFHIYLVHQIFILNTFSILRLTSNKFVNVALIFMASFVVGVVYFYFSKFIMKMIKSLATMVARNKVKVAS